MAHNLHSSIHPIRSVWSDGNNRVIITGLFASTLVVLFTLFYSSLFDLATYTGWVAFVWMTAVPAQIIFGLHIQFACPKALAYLPQPQKGLAYTALTLVMMLLGGTYLYAVPGGMTAPGPFLIMAMVVTVVVTFWLVCAWQCWPFTRMTQDPFKQGILVFIASYFFGYVFYQLCFDFNFLAGSPIYSSTLDPKGMFDAWMVLSFSVTTVGVMMVMSLFEFWPCTRISTTQPGQGIVVTLLNLSLSSSVFWLAVFYLKMNPVDFMVRVPISVIFGIFLVTNMMQFQLFNQWKQPARAVALFVVTMILAYTMQLLYRSAIPYLIGTSLQAGAPNYDTELWVATALLAITFPLINLVSGYFAFWPLKRD